MIPVIERHRDELNRLCRRFHVRRLELFGSAAAGRFEPGKSDLDFLVEFDSLAPGDYADSYFGLLESLAELYGSAVDLVVPTAVHNPYFRASIEKNRSLLYAA